ncbi:TonB-dependent receptor [Phenylobacterium sp.]|uniref:TonB-dependent receptor plug domain-containing protein n=1 Tax=Phenylobacterium sp. TaxID=1871053 RepID=UPI0025D333AD|nr:TonB-dependent receptor [Phenylobacterium sp.]
MNILSLRERLLASSTICCVAALAFANPAAAAAAATSTDEVSEVVVTGTRIPTPNLTSVSPVTAISAQDLKAQGVTRVEDLINSLPQAFASQGSAISNGSTGTATVNLRGLGPTRTLVLIDGRRLMPGTPNTTGASLSADLNFIPGALIQRVDVLTGGASAVYGADAVAGVVNFILQKNFEGVRIDTNYGIYQHDNNNDAFQSVVKAARAASANPQFYGLPKKNVRDGEQSEVTLVVGVNAPDGKGNVTAYAGYRHVEPILQANRDYSSCTVNSGTPDFSQFGCGGSGTAFPARVGGFVVDVTGPGNTFRPRVAARDVYNFGPSNYYQRPDDRYVMGAFANYEVAPWAKVYADLMFMDDTSTYQIAPGGIFAGTFSVNCANPFLSAQQAGLLVPTVATGGGTCATNPAGVFTGTISRRNIEGGGRQGQIEHTQYRYVIGIKGDLNDAFTYDFYMQYGRVAFHQVQTGYFRKTAIDNALNVVNVNGVPTCASVVTKADLACVPYNIFQLGGVDKAALAYLQTPSSTIGNLFERVVNLSIGGDLTDYGVKSPWAADGVGISVGAEYRREQLDYAADFVASSGALNGAGGASPPVSGSYDIYELFGEARIPIVTDRPFIKRAQVELAYRYSDYSSTGTTDTYKIAGDWQIVDDLRVRGSYQRAVRAPHVLELFSPPNVTLDGTQDPCAGLAAASPLVARCAAIFNLTTAQVLAIERNPANQYNGQLQGNRNLTPETSDTFSVGVVATPTFLPGFNLSADYFDIKVKDFIGTVGADVTINSCITGNDAASCALVHRDAAGSIWLSPQGFVADQTVNTGSLRTKGIDVNAGYRTDLDRFGLENMGAVSLNFVGTWLDSLKVQSAPGGPAFDCAGLYGTVCSVAGGLSSPNPTWRHKLRLTWNTPFEYGDWIKNASLSLQWRHFNKVRLDAFDKDPQLNNTGIAYESDRTLGARDYFDLTASWTVRGNLNFRAGVNNIFDRDPPLTGASNCPNGPCNGNTWPQLYDAFGRYAFIGLTADF